MFFYQGIELTENCIKGLMLVFTDENNILLRKPVSELYRLLSQFPV